MNETRFLSDLQSGKHAEIAGLTGSGERRRLRELGMSDGAGIECVLKHRNISAYLIKGAVIALRDSDAQAVIISTGEQAGVFRK